MIDYKKDYKNIYVPKKNPQVIDVPEMMYLTIEGEGDPNQEAFRVATEALYSLSYAVKMSYKSNDVPASYYEYKVFPLEGIWDLIDHTKGTEDKSNFKYTLMIRQPDFLTPELFERFRVLTFNKKKNPRVNDVKLEKITEGLSLQMMHIGPYDDEPASFVKMQKFCEENGYTRAVLTHKEIYLSDPRKSAPEKLKTVLRISISE